MLIPLGILASQAAPGLSAFAYFRVSGTDIDKFDFATDSRSAVTFSTSFGDSASNRGVAAYHGTVVSGSVRLIGKFLFASDTQASTAATLSTDSSDLRTMENSEVAGYFAGGVKPGFTAWLSTVDKLSFSAETRSTLGTGLSIARAGSNRFSDLGVAGYIAGGYQSGFSRVDRVDKFAFPSDTRSTLSLATINSEGSGMQDTAVAGYVAGGRTTGTTLVSTVVRFAFPSDTRTNLSTGLSSNRHFPAGSSAAGIAGYVGGGRTTFDGASVTTVDKFAFPSETRSTLGTGLSVATSAIGAFHSQGQ
jgi:hypothetical protein